jgi:hypothetical protein
MKRRIFLSGVTTAIAGSIGALPAAAKQLRQSMKRAPTSVGKRRDVRIDDEHAYEFTLGPDKFEPGKGSRQREELRDVVSNASGTVRYRIEFLFPTIDDPDGRLESKFIFFQIKPKDTRTSTGDWFPYLTVQIEPDYRRVGPYTDFEFTVGDQRGTASRRPIKQNVWHQLEVVVKWSQGNDGFATVAIDGNRIASFNGKTGPDGEPLVNFGIYRSYLHRADPAKVETLQFYVRRYASERIDG